MPPKTTTCSICHNTVMKSQTLARTDGSRACRSHEGVAEESEMLQQQAERDRIAHMTESNEKKRWPRMPDYGTPIADAAMDAFRYKVHKTCWTCNEPGIELGEFFAGVMVAMKRLELRGEFNFVTWPEDVGKFMNERRALATLELKDETIDRAIVKHVKDAKIRDIIPVFNFVRLCAPCATKHGFKQRWDDLLPKPSYDQIEAMFPVVEAVQPVLTEIAERKERQS